MHRLLHVEEILRAIFDHCNKREDLTALARTCKTFKEPALDILWAELSDLTLLLRCTPDILHQDLDGRYSLKRPLDGADWDTIFSYTRRVRTCWAHSYGVLTAECLKALSEPPSSIPLLFPKLSGLVVFNSEIVPLVQHFVGPRLTILNLHLIQDIGEAIRAFGERCPNITVLDYYPQAGMPTPDEISSLICHWPRLRCVRGGCPALNVAAITHLSRLPDLYYLRVELSDAVVDRVESSASLLTFPALVHYELHASAAAVRNFLHRFRFPSIEQLILVQRYRPTEQELRSILAVLPDRCNHKSLATAFMTYTELQLDLHPYHIDFHHLLPLAVFTNIQTIHLMILCGVDLNERELLRLASSWPRLRVFIVGGNEGCTASSSITPGGFVQLLERCRSLSRFSFPFNVHGYTEIPKGHPWNGLEMLKDSAIDVRHSVIEDESIRALAVFFHVAPFPKFSLGFGLDGYRFSGVQHLPEPFRLYHRRWEMVRSLAQELSERPRHVT